MSGVSNEPETESDRQTHGARSNRDGQIRTRSNRFSVTADDVWDVVPNCSIKQALLVTCIVYTLMHRVVLVCFSMSNTN